MEGGSSEQRVAGKARKECLERIAVVEKKASKTTALSSDVVL